ncbi:MAG TPA: peptide deformylase [Bacteroidales bacterium]|nr:peptide deformylase [Bacteroidales bacterium]HPS16553.1 peptide deformylase [Bacteroidales bacterium]
MKNLFYILPFLLIGVTNYYGKKDIAFHDVEVVDSLAYTQAEKDAILKGDTNDIMRILITSIYDDSLILRKQSREVRVDASDSVLYRIVRRMYYTLMASGGGVGIAAPQVGINRDIIWLQRLDKVGKPFEYYLNPKIVLYSNKAVLFTGDGCLSIPGVNGNSHRYSAVVVEYDLLDGSHHEELIEGYGGSNFTAIIFQHEIDHLNGILFIDRLNKEPKGKLSRVAEINAVELFKM